MTKITVDDVPDELVAEIERCRGLLDRYIEDLVGGMEIESAPFAQLVSEYVGTLGRLEALLAG